MPLFTLSKYAPLNTTISDATGPLYTIVTPFNLFHGVTKISKRAQPSALQSTSASTRSLSSGHGAPEDRDGKQGDGMEEIARINWHYWEGSRLVYNSQIMDITTLMPADNITRLWVARTCTVSDTHGPLQIQDVRRTRWPVVYMVHGYIHEHGEADQ